LSQSYSQSREAEILYPWVRLKAIFTNIQDFLLNK